MREAIGAYEEEEREEGESEKEMVAGEGVVSSQNFPCGLDCSSSSSSRASSSPTSCPSLGKTSLRKGKKRKFENNNMLWGCKQINQLVFALKDLDSERAKREENFFEKASKDFSTAIIPILQPPTDVEERMKQVENNLRSEMQSVKTEMQSVKTDLQNKLDLILSKLN